jgi:hypothetical protein
MAVTEHDLETLEVWLDGELPEMQADALRQRLSTEPELAQTLDRIRGERKIRAAIWNSMESSGGEAERLVASVRRGMRREDVINSRLRAVRNLSAVAAGIAIVFMAGWLSRGRLQVQPQNPMLSAIPANLPSVVPGPGAMPKSSFPTFPDVTRGNIQVANASGSLAISRNLVQVLNPMDPRARVLAGSAPGIGQPVLPRYKVYVVSPMQQVFMGEPGSLSELKDLQQQIEQIERRPPQSTPVMPSLTQPGQ